MAKLFPFFPKSHGKPRVDDRRDLSGIIFIDRDGLHWRDAPREYGPHKMLYSRWKRWSEKGIFARMMIGLAAEHGEKKTVVIPSHRNCVSTAGSGCNLSESLPYRDQLGREKGGVAASSVAPKAA